MIPTVVRRKAPAVTRLLPALLPPVAAALAVAAAGTPRQALAAGKAEHVVVVVWDGMRPDFITPQYCPTLYSLATNGVYFRNHHPAWVSTTEVNGAAIATGANPGHNGILANVVFNPDINFLAGYATEGLDAVRRGDAYWHGQYMRAATTAEILQDAGIPTVVAGTKPIALLHDRSAKRETKAEKASVLLWEGKTNPRAAGEGLPKVNDDKPFPSNAIPNAAQDSWTTRALTRSLWKNGVPKYSLLWLSEPDKAQHDAGVGAPNALAGIESSDRNLAEVIRVLKEKGVYEKTDIMVVSDHGFSTISRGPDIIDILKKAKFNVMERLDNPEAGDIMVVPLGGTAMFYVIGRDQALIQRLVDYLQTLDFTGVIFSRTPMEGTFSYESVGYSVTNFVPDLMMSFRWSPERNEYGAPGMFQIAKGAKGKGSHGSLSRFDQNNTLVAAGPDFKRGYVSKLASGNVDVAPTTLWILGVQPPRPMDGRVLHEALSTSRESVPEPTTRVLEAQRDTGLFQWRQYLKFTTVGTTSYFDEGNGEPVLR